jgi:two-component system, OmpR family, sensor kinase
MKVTGRGALRRPVAVGAAIALDGPDLSPEDRKRVFERFFRADASRSRESGGVGLGLSIVAAVTKAHGGRVDASSTPGSGALFRITFPLSGSERPVGRAGDGQLA